MCDHTSLRPSRKDASRGDCRRNDSHRGRSLEDDKNLVGASGVRDNATTSVSSVQSGRRRGCCTNSGEAVAAIGLLKVASLKLRYYGLASLTKAKRLFGPICEDLRTNLAPYGNAHCVSSVCSPDSSFMSQSARRISRNSLTTSLSNAPTESSRTLASPIDPTRNKLSATSGSPTAMTCCLTAAPASVVTKRSRTTSPPVPGLRVVLLSVCCGIYVYDSAWSATTAR